MSWTDLEPVMKVVPRAQASTHVNKDGKPRVRLFLSEAMLNDSGHPKAANVQFGVIGGVPKLRLVFDQNGKFKIHNLGRGGSRINNIPAKDPVPDGARETEPCEVESASRAEAIIVLPVAAWAKQVTAPSAARQRIAATPAPTAQTRLHWIPPGTRRKLERDSDYEVPHAA